MILVDTSTWINHFRLDNQRLRNLLSGAKFWTEDRRVHAVAEKPKISF